MDKTKAISDYYNAKQSRYTVNFMKKYDITGWKVDIFDITFLIAYLYLEGTDPWSLKMGDISGDCAINIFDITYLISFLYMDGPAPKVGCE